ncbi:hypothetical protein A9Q81_14990 [Gammaproteobacteria bacterium 42_54_T18]|nr:hypothetical protein A9Q81_14990 [Gammaproteobacteria bacterium 42_54_T18]
MKVTSSYIGISRQIIIIVLLIMAFVTVGLSIVVGVTSFNNLATLTLDELGRTSKILSSQLHELERNAVESIVDIEKNTLLLNRFEQLTNLGPYYFSDESQKDRDIDESDKIYTLQSQLEIVQALRPFQNIHQLSSISFFYLSPFEQFEHSKPVLSLRMDREGVFVGQFKTKGKVDNRSYHYVDFSNYEAPTSDLFNVSSVYELTIHEFYKKFNFNIAATIGISEIYDGFDIEDLKGNDRIQSSLIINDGLPVIRTLAPVLVPVSNPETWEAESVPAILMVIDQTIDEDMLGRLKKQLGIDVALAKKDTILVSSLPENERFGYLKNDQTVSSSVQNFYYSWQKIKFGEPGGDVFQAVVLSPISVLATLTRGLFLQMSLLVALATILSTVAIFAAIRRLVNKPLNQLMDGVEKISSGDLTHRVQVRSKNELGELASEFNLMSDKLAKKSDELQSKIEALKEMDKLKDSFLANTSHELRTPLNGIIGIADSMIDGATGDVSEVQLVNLSMIVSSGRRLSSLVDDILDFSKMRHHDLQLMLAPVDIKTITNIVLTLSKTLVKKKDLKLIEVIENDLPLVEADENRLQQILYNLVGNALKFTNSGYVSISAYLVGEKMEVSVTDSGIGIPLNMQKNIFDSFSQAEESISREYGGTGLGLAVTKQLVELHGGEIWIKSTPGIGSAFFFTLPLSATKRADLDKSLPIYPTEGERVGSHVVTPNMELEESKFQSFDRKTDDDLIDDAGDAGGDGEFTVLVVDDEPVNLQVISNHLSLHRYTVVEAVSGLDALNIIGEGNKIDLILLDVMMPKMSGFEVCQKLREEHSPIELPVILVTAKNQATDLIEGFSSGANDYLTKPFSKYELLARINLHIQLSRSSKEIIEKERMLNKYADNLKLTNDELKQYQSSLESMVEKRTLKLKDAQKQLIESEKMASLGELVAGVAHEINTPVGVGVTAASFLADETKGIEKKYTNESMTREDFSDFLTCSLQTTEMILSNLQRATELIKSFKKVAVDQTAEDKRCFFVTSYVGEILRTLHPRIKKTKHNIEVVSGNDMEINSYPGTFSQILTNLIMNSIIHAFDDSDAGNIVIDIKQKDDGIILSFSDDGKGVNKDDLSKVFDPFFTTKRGRGGTGLGLHIVYNLVTQKLKGNIRCESTVGKGTVFYIYIPSIVE